MKSVACAKARRPAIVSFPLPSLVALCAVVVVACGGRARSPTGAPPGDGMGGQAGSSSAACELPPPAPPSVEGGPPASFACAANVTATWEERPCSCELWLRNPVAAPVQAAMHFVFTPSGVTPSLSDEPVVELRFPDPTSSWRDIWSSQAGAGADFNLVAADGVTTVRLGTTELTLDPVTLASCARLIATASVSGPWGTRLSLAMSAAFSDASGTLVESTVGECDQPATHPTPIPPDAGDAAGGPAQ